MLTDTYAEPIKLFHSKFASCFKDYPTAPHFWKHAFESCYIFPNTLTPGSNTALAAGAATSKVCHIQETVVAVRGLMLDVRCCKKLEVRGKKVRD